MTDLKKFFYFDWRPSNIRSSSLSSPEFNLLGVKWRFLLTYDYYDSFRLRLEKMPGSKPYGSFTVQFYIERGSNPATISFGSYSVSNYAGQVEVWRDSNGNLFSNCSTARLLFLFDIQDGLAGVPQSQTGNQLAETSSPLPKNSCLKSLSEDFGNLLDGDATHDVVLKCGGETFNAHRAVLCARSKVFQSMLLTCMVEGQTGQVEIQDIGADVFKDFLRFLYTGALSKLSEDKAKELYEAADKYDVKSLLQLCSNFLTKSLTPKNSCDLLVLADAHSDQQFKENVTKYILEKKIPLTDELWEEFSDRCPVLAVKVVNRFCKLQASK